MVFKQKYFDSYDMTILAFFDTKLGGLKMCNLVALLLSLVPFGVYYVGSGNSEVPTNIATRCYCNSFGLFEQFLSRIS